MIGESRVYAHHLQPPRGSNEPYWRDVGTLDAYYQANLDLCSLEPKFNLYDLEWPVYTLWHNDPPAKTAHRAEVTDSLLAPGTIISDASVRSSVLASRAIVEDGTEIDASILFAGVQVGRGCRLRRTIVDKWNRIPEGTEIGFDRQRDAERFTVTESGIVVVPRGTEF